jgi:serine/threonine-protein kinase
MEGALAEKYGNYELTRYLATGGMADLWLARSQTVAGELVIKKIQPRYVEHERVIKMFIDEGRIAQALRHPNIVRVVDVGQEDGTYYIAMEYIPGADLLAICRRGVEVGKFLPRHLAVAILEQATRGLVYAHERCDEDGRPLSVVHCDLSPGNIVVGWAGTVKLVDFGIARATIMLREEDESVAGKYNYMAPEQIKGGLVDARADLFSLGIMLYELTVGKRLFRGGAPEVIQLVCEKPILPPTTLQPDYCPKLEKIVMRALERDPDRRYPSARVLRDELRLWLRESGEAYGKREIADYLCEVFDLPKQRQADEFAGETYDAQTTDEELLLEKSAPFRKERLYDPEDVTKKTPIRKPWPVLWWRRLLLRLFGA